MSTRLPARLATGLALALPPALPAALVAQQAAPAPAVAPSAARAALADTLPFDPLVRRGTLPNGMRYYIRHNEKPEKRAELRLVVNAGSVLEDDDQRGLAHVTEHMAFNGTRRFAKSAIVSFLESSGMRFGADLNAYTSFDETVYMLQVPTDSAAIFRRSFDILGDWAQALTFDSTEVDKERGVVIEEWRSRRGAAARIADKQLPILFRGSRYAERLPIGGPEALRAFRQPALRRFYQTWYRPDLMAVVAVGDFDADSVERVIRAEFADLAKPAAPTARPVTPVPGNDTTLFAIATDKEATSSSVAILWKLPKRDQVTVGDYRQQLVERMYDAMLNERFEELTQKPDAPFLGAGSGEGSFVRSAEVYQLGASVKEGGIVRGLEGLLTEAARVARFGFTAGELARQKTDFLRGAERAWAEREKTPSARYAGEYVSAFLEKEPVPGIAAEYPLMQQLVPTITLDEVNAVGKAWITDRNRVVLASAPEKPGLAPPTPAELAAVFAKVEGATVMAYVDSTASGALVEKAPAKGRIVATARHPEVGAVEWTLSNGVRVLVKPTDFQADQVLVSAFSPGGLSLAPDSLVIPAATSTIAVTTGGVGRFSVTDLQKALTGKVARVQPFVSDLYEGFAGNASPRDLETLMQLLYLQFTAPRRDTTAYAATRQRIDAFVKNRGSDPQAVFQDTLSVTLSQHSPRSPLFSTATIARMDLDRSLAFYRQRFADASDFTFVFVGNVDTAQFKPLVEQWLGALPATRRKESWVDRHLELPAGVVQRVVKAGVEPKARTQLVFHGPATPTAEERAALAALDEITTIRLREVLREDKGGTYGVGVSSGISSQPAPRYTFAIGFGAAPERIEELTQAVFQVVDSLKRVDVSAEELAKAKEIQRRERETAARQNGWWLSHLVAERQEGRPLGAFLADSAALEKVDAAAVRRAAAKYLDTTRYVRASLFPEKFEGATAK